MKSRLWLLVILMLACVNVINAQQLSNDELKSIFLEANNEYKQGNYEKALELYNKIYNSGYMSLELYTNLGNTYFKLKNYPEAILYYERAKRLNQNDERILNNLALANLQIKDKPEPQARFFVTVIYEQITGLLSSTGWGVLVVVLLWITLALLISYRILTNIFRKKFTLVLAGIFFSLAVIFFVFGSSRYAYETNQAEAIVFYPVVYVTTEPKVNSPNAFILHEGSKVTILEEQDEWYFISYDKTKKGWISKSAVKII